MSSTTEHFSHSNYKSLSKIKPLLNVSNDEIKRKNKALKYHYNEFLPISTKMRDMEVTNSTKNTINKIVSIYSDNLMKYKDYTVKDLVLLNNK